MHLLRYLKMLGRMGSRTGITEEAQQELAKAQEENALIHSMGEDFRRLKRRAIEVRERNGFDELMSQLVNPSRGGTRPHGSTNGR